ncbi:MAG: hypothetical protein C4584_01670 [Armatimonadetes bacterium]|nr:MAG: hypothetical protein C4584_01670 [Armatimonadota bacterium]
MSLAEDKEGLFAILGDPTVASLEEMKVELSGNEKTRQGEGLPIISDEIGEELIRRFGLESDFKTLETVANIKNKAITPLRQATIFIREIQIPLLRKSVKGFEEQWERWLRGQSIDATSLQFIILGACLVLDAFCLVRDSFVSDLERISPKTRLHIFESINYVVRNPKIVFDLVDQEEQGLPHYQAVLQSCIDRLVNLAADEYNTREGAYMAYRLLEILWEKRTKEIS